MPPHNLDAERSLLGGILLDGTALVEVRPLVLPDDFYREAHRRLFAAMCGLSDRNEPVDRVTVKAELVRAGWLEDIGEDFIDLLDKYVPTAANLTYYAKIVSDKSLVRRVIETAGVVSRLGYEQHEEAGAFADQCEARFYALRRTDSGKGFTKARDLVTTAFKEIEARGEHDTTLTGAPSGLTELDEKTGGFQEGHLVIIAARPSAGKTSLLGDILRSVCKLGGGAGMFSLEMPKAELIERFLSGEGRVDSTHIRTGQLRGPEWERLAQAAGHVADWHLYIDDTARTILEIRALARRLAAKLSAQGQTLRIIGVDYLQLMHGTGREESREQVVSNVSRELKALAKELSIPIIALSQLNRELEKRPNKRPQLSDLRESGALEQDADEVIFVYRGVLYGDKEMGDDEADLVVGKQRNGPLGDVRVKFVKEYSSFRDRPVHEQARQLRLDEPPPLTDEDRP